MTNPRINDESSDELTREDIIAEAEDIAGKRLTFAEAVAVLVQEGYDQDDPVLREWNNGR